MTPEEQLLFEVDDTLTLLPVIHGSLDVTLHVRRILLSQSWSMLAVPLPDAFAGEVMGAVDALPRIHVVTRQETQPGLTSYVPIDPCQPVISALRLARQEYLPVVWTEDDTPVHHRHRLAVPDTYSLRTVSLERFFATLLPSIPEPTPDTAGWPRIHRMAQRIQHARPPEKPTLVLCDWRDWPWLRDALTNPGAATEETGSYQVVQRWGVAENSLLFVLGELPYVTYQFEKARMELLPEENLSVDSIRQLMLDTRDHWLRTQKPLHNWATPQRLRVLLQYIRNLTLLQSRLTPDLFTLGTAAKQVLGDTFAIALIETARQYPYQHDEPRQATFGIDQARFPDGTSGPVLNRLDGGTRQWRRLELKKQPDPNRQKELRQRWNPLSMCSWPPEDERIESLNTHVREVALSILGDGLAKTEKFQTSLKDGLDIRESIRHWYDGDLYVREMPPARGSIDAVVFLFDSPADHETYSWCTTWYAEHEEESTLSFYATPLGSRMIGPGIAQSQYGGCLFLFPPRMIPDIWTDPRLNHYLNLEERLLAGACLNARHKSIAVVSAQPLLISWKQIARRFRKKLIRIPLSRFSTSLLDRLRLFHVLNGKQVRSFAAHYIRSL